MRRSFKNIFALTLLLTLLAGGLFSPAFCESAPRATFIKYIQSLYYATNVKQCSKYWTKNARVPMDECLGTAEVAKLAELKKGYVYRPQITTEVLNGNFCTMKGVGIASSQGVRCNAKLDVVMHYEEGSWKIQYYVWAGEIPGHY